VGKTKIVEYVVHGVPNIAVEITASAFEIGFALDHMKGTDPSVIPAMPT
jgi:hypothetical protein